MRSQGRAVRLERRPMDLLILFVERRGELITRQEIVARLWKQDVFVDVDTSVNTVIWKLRAALRDSTESPRFIETVPGKGYRFVAALDMESTAQPRAPEGSEGASLRAPAEAMVDPAARHPGPFPDGDGTAVSGGVILRRSRSPYPWWPHRLRALAAGPLLLLVPIVAAAVWMGGRPSDPHSLTIAVLPFEDTGPEAADQYLADGLGEEIIAELSRIDPQRLAVAPRNSVLAYIREGRSRAERAQDLEIDFVLEGDLAAHGDHVRVRSSLRRAADQSVVWSAVYSRERSNVRSVSREVMGAVAEHVRIDIRPNRLIGLDRRQTSDPAAYEAYLRARYFENQRNRESTARAIQYYEQAIALDPAYALAWSGLSFTYAASAINSDTDPREVWPRARSAAENGVRANPDLAEAQFAFGYVQWLLDWNWTRAEAAFRRAIELDPTHVTAHRTLGHVLSQMGLHREAERLMAHTRALDPFSPMSHALSAQIAFQARDNAGATRHARRATLVDSQFWIGHMQLAQAYAHGGETDLALEALADAARFSGGENSKTLSFRGYVMGRLGRTVEAEEALRALAATAATRYVPPYASALVHAGLGNSTAAFEWLDRAFTARDVNLIFLPSDPKWDPYREDQRFRSLLQRCGFVQLKK
ncbi:MAG: winged helix-turn-helix domain-containing protein [Acidobacteria bacterium]|nr:winged helix-turn-helix domain-containing protein [Acidobacteriota bacterium]